MKTEQLNYTNNDDTKNNILHIAPFNTTPLILISPDSDNIFGNFVKTILLNCGNDTTTTGSTTR